MVTTSEIRAQRGEIKFMKNTMIRYILNSASTKLPIKSIDIVKNCLGGESKRFLQLLPEVRDDLSEVYGLQIHEVKEKSLKYYLVTSEFCAGSAEEMDVKHRQDMRLLFIVLSFIFMKGGKVIEPQLYSFLTKLGIEHEPHEFFGEFKKQIQETFVKQMYLRKEKVELEASEYAERFQYSWGHRADLEYKKKDILAFVAELMKRTPESFGARFEECNSDAEDDAMEEM